MKPYLYGERLWCLSSLSVAVFTLQSTCGPVSMDLHLPAVRDYSVDTAWQDVCMLVSILGRMHIQIAQGVIQAVSHTCDGVVHIGELVARDAVVVPEEAPEIVHVARLQRADIGFADADVLRGGVGVQLLVPLLYKLVLDALHAAQGLPSAWELIAASRLPALEVAVCLNRCLQRCGSRSDRLHDMLKWGRDRLSQS